MLKVIKHKKFIKSIKKYRHNKPVLIELEKVMLLLLTEKAIPAKYRDHELKGKLKGIRELHLKPDALLLYFKLDRESVTLLDIGNHANMLRM